MGSGVTNILSVVEARSLGSADIDKITQAIDKQNAALDKLSQSSKKVNDDPGFSAFAEKVKAGIENPLQAAGEGVKSLLTKLGPAGVGIAATGAAILALGAAGLSAARELGHLGDEIEDTASRLGIGTREAQEFKLAMKLTGGDITALEGVMKKLSQEVEDGGEKLSRMGIRFREAKTGAVRPITDVVIELMEQLRQMPDVTARNAAAVDVLGRGVLAVLPDLLELPDAIKDARTAARTYSDQELESFRKLHKEMVLLDEQWEFTTTKLKQGLVIPVSWFFNWGNKEEEKKILGRVFGSGNFQVSPTRDPFAGASAEFRAKVEAARAQTAAQQAAETAANAPRVALNRALVDAALGATDDDRLSAAKKKLEEDIKTLRGLKDVLPERSEEARKNVAADRAEIASIEARIKATKDLETALKSLANWEQQLAQKDLNPVEKIFAQRDEQASATQQFDRATSAALPAALQALQKMRFEDQKEALQTWGKNLDYFEKQHKEFWDQVSEDANRGASSTVRDFLEAVRAVQQANREIENINVSVAKSDIGARAGRAVRLAELGAGPGREIDAVRVAYQERIRLAEELRDIEYGRAEREVDANKQRVDFAKAEADFKREIQDAEIEHEIRIAELQRQRLDNLRNEAGRLFDALLQGPKGLQQFARDFLLGEARKVFQNIAVEVFKGASTHLGLPGKIFQGTIFGQDPLKGATDLLKASTDDNSLKTVDNTAAIRELTAALQAARAGAVSPSGGGGSFSPSFSTFNGLVQRGLAEEIGYGASQAAGYSRNAAGLVVRGADASLENLPLSHRSGTDPLLLYPELEGVGSKNSSSRASGAGIYKGVGYAAAGVAAYSGARTIAHGGAQNALGGSGELAGAAAGILMLAGVSGPAAPILAGVGLGLGLVSSLLGDPKQRRQKEIDSWLQSHQYQGPDPVSIVTDLKGRDLSYDMRGNLRPINVTNVTNNHVSAIDSQDVAKFFEKNAAAVNRGVAKSIREGGDLVPELSSALGLS